MQLRSAFQIPNGLGAGNIGDDLMNQAFWRQLPEDFLLRVGVFSNYTLQHQRYPGRHYYVEVAASPHECAQTMDLPGLLVGATCVTDGEGPEFPLGFLAPRLQHFLNHGLSVDALGVGVDFLVTERGRQYFSEAFLPIRSWTVRDEAARNSLLELGVEEFRIRVGADWAWLHRQEPGLEPWAEVVWRDIGIDPAAPLLVVNPFFQEYMEELPTWTAIAAALDDLRKRAGLQIAFFCNECRDPGFDYQAARTLQRMMREPAAVVPNQYYSPSEAIALLGSADVTLGQRYHFGVESVLAGSAPVMLGRGQKIAGLCRELDLRPCGTLQSIDREELIAAVEETIRNGAAIRGQLAVARERLAERAERNLDFFRLFHL